MYPHNNLRFNRIPTVASRHDPVDPPYVACWNRKFLKKKGSWIRIKGMFFGFLLHI